MSLVTAVEGKNWIVVQRIIENRTASDNPQDQTSAGNVLHLAILNRCSKEIALGLLDWGITKNGINFLAAKAKLQSRDLFQLCESCSSRAGEKPKFTVEDMLDFFVTQTQTGSNTKVYVTEESLLILIDYFFKWDKAQQRLWSLLNFAIEKHGMKFLERLISYNRVPPITNEEQLDRKRKLFNFLLEKINEPNSAYATEGNLIVILSCLLRYPQGIESYWTEFLDFATTKFDTAFIIKCPELHQFFRTSTNIGTQTCWQLACKLNEQNTALEQRLSELETKYTQLLMLINEGSLVKAQDGQFSTPSPSQPPELSNMYLEHLRSELEQVESKLENRTSQMIDNTLRNTLAQYNNLMQLIDGWLKNISTVRYKTLTETEQQPLNTSSPMRLISSRAHMRAPNSEPPARRSSIARQKVERDDDFTAVNSPGSSSNPPFPNTKKTITLMNLKSLVMDWALNGTESTPAHKSPYLLEPVLPSNTHLFKLKAERLEKELENALMQEKQIINEILSYDQKLHLAYRLAEAIQSHCIPAPRRHGFPFFKKDPFHIHFNIAVKDEAAWNVLRQGFSKIINSSTRLPDAQPISSSSTSAPTSTPTPSPYYE